MNTVVSFQNSLKISVHGNQTVFKVYMVFDAVLFMYTSISHLSILYNVRRVVKTLTLIKNMEF